jgi:hypothetical protein
LAYIALVELGLPILDSSTVYASVAATTNTAGIVPGAGEWDVVASKTCVGTITLIAPIQLCKPTLDALAVDAARPIAIAYATNIVLRVAMRDTFAVYAVVRASTIATPVENKAAVRHVVTADARVEPAADTAGIEALARILDSIAADASVVTTADVARIYLCTSIRHAVAVEAFVPVAI